MISSISILPESFVSRNNPENYVNNPENYVKDPKGVVEGIQPPQEGKVDDDKEKSDDFSDNCVYDDSPPELITWQELLKISNDTTLLHKHAGISYS